MILPAQEACVCVCACVYVCVCVSVCVWRGLCGRRSDYVLLHTGLSLARCCPSFPMQVHLAGGAVGPGPAQTSRRGCGAWGPCRHAGPCRAVPCHAGLGLQWGCSGATCLHSSKHQSQPYVKQRENRCCFSICEIKLLDCRQVFFFYSGVGAFTGR